MDRKNAVTNLQSSWATDERWKNISRAYSAEEVVSLRGSMNIEYTFAQQGASRLWNLMHNDPFVRALGALTGNQAVQQVKAGLKAIYLSGWQVAPTQTLLVKCTLTKACIQRTVYQRW